MKAFAQRWLITTLAVLVAANVVKGIRYDSIAGVFVASLLLGILNAFVRPIMMILALPFLIYTLGLFMLVINAFLLYFVGQLVRPFHVNGFWPAFWGALIISLVSFCVNRLLGTRNSRLQIHRNRGARRRPDGDGPVIDV